LAVIDSVFEAVDVVKELLRREFGNDIAFEIGETNFGRHMVVAAYRGSKLLKKVYVVYEREPFHKFCDYFPEYCREIGKHVEALTMNWEIVWRALEIGVSEVIYVLRDGRIYSVEPKKFLELNLCRYPKHESITKICHVPLNEARLVTLLVPTAVDTITPRTMDDITRTSLGRKTIAVFTKWLLEHPKPINDVIEAYRIIVERFDRETKMCIQSEEGCEPLYPPAYRLAELAFVAYLRKREMAKPQRSSCARTDPRRTSP